MKDSMIYRKKRCLLITLINKGNQVKMPLHYLIHLLLVFIYFSQQQFLYPVFFVPITFIAIDANTK